MLAFEKRRNRNIPSGNEVVLLAKQQSVGNAHRPVFTSQ